MRILSINILLALLLSQPAMTQALKDTNLFDPGIRMIQQAVTAGDYKMAAAYFEKLDAPGSEKWLGQYYAALCYIHESYKTGGNKAKDGLLDKAQLRIDSAYRLKPDDPELLVLQAFLHQSRIQINPEFRGASYSMKADASLKKAAALDENNPRVWSLMGYNIFHTPALFGGGPEKALPLFLKARDKFLTFKPVLPYMPHWGEKENQQMIEECKKAKR